MAAQQHFRLGGRGGCPATRRNARLAWIVAAAAVLALTACATGVERMAERADLERVDLEGTHFLHRSYVKRGPGDLLHVFIEGDGRPWVDGQIPAADPTPRDPLTLRLMLRTPGPAVYVGRPCYFSVTDPRCEPHYWTHGRFAPEVVASMRAVIDTLIERAGTRECVLVGHSGGAAIALLVAPDLTHHCGVVTVAGLIDTAAWTRWRGYEPLDGSLNPAETLARVAGIPQVHLVGLRDRNIPAEQTKRALGALHGATVLELETFDHGCCWEREWRSILPRIERSLTSAAGGD